MSEKNLLKDKSVLVVDDEIDVLETLEQLLPMCVVTKAQTFEMAKRLLETRHFDIAILDIMGVNGFELLRIARERKVIPILLTAHAISVETTMRGIREGADSYIPKEEMKDIVTFLNDVLEAKETGKNTWWRWLDRFAEYYDRKFGTGWQSTDKDFWEKFPYNL